LGQPARWQESQVRQLALLPAAQQVEASTALTRCPPNRGKTTLFLHAVGGFWLSIFTA